LVLFYDVVTLEQSRQHFLQQIFQQHFLRAEVMHYKPNTYTHK